MGLSFTNGSMHGQLTGYSDIGFLSDPHVGRSQTSYVFLVGGTTISWRSTKQTLAATSSNHAKILALHEASRECLWLQCCRSVFRTLREKFKYNISDLITHK